MDPIVCSISLRKLSHWIVQMPLINCNFLQFFAKTCGCLQTTLSTRLIRKLNGPENTVSVKRTYQASTIKFWFLKSMQPIGPFNNYVDIIIHFFEYLSRLLCHVLYLTWHSGWDWFIMHVKLRHFMDNCFIFKKINKN